MTPTRYERWTIQDAQQRRADWQRLCAESPAADSPLLSLDVLAAASRAWDTVAVGVALSEDRVVAMLPLIVEGAAGLDPLRHFADYSVVLREPGFDIDWARMLEACGVHWLRLANAPCGDERLAAENPPNAAPTIDISRGFAAYEEDRRQAGSRELRETLRKDRKLRKDLGDVRFEFDCRDGGRLRELIALKRAHLRATGSWDGLDQAWVSNFFEDLWRDDHTEARGVLSVVTAGDRLIAGTWGLMSQRVYHGWITSFDPEWRRYSPGSILLASLLREAAERGVARVDMGGGGENYKHSFANGAVSVRPFEVQQGATGWVARCWDNLRRTAGRCRVQLGRAWTRAKRRLGDQHYNACYEGARQ